MPDNRNTHTPAARDDACPPAAARRILRRLGFHSPPTPASRRTQAEIAFSVPAGQCLDRRLPDTALLTHEVAAWERDRNAAEATVGWRVTVGGARDTLHRRYPAALAGCGTS